MPFIVETSATHHGIKLYVVKADPPSRSFRLRGIRNKAVRFSTRLDADIARNRFSSLYGLITVEVK